MCEWPVPCRETPALRPEHLVGRTSQGDRHRRVGHPVGLHGGRRGGHRGGGNRGRHGNEGDRRALTGAVEGDRVGGVGGGVGDGLGGGVGDGEGGHSRAVGGGRGGGDDRGARSPAARETDLPASATPLSSFRVTVTVELATPSASTDVGDAVTVELATVALGVVKVTVGVWPAPLSGHRVGGVGGGVGDGLGGGVGDGEGGHPRAVGGGRRGGDHRGARCRRQGDRPSGQRHPVVVLQGDRHRGGCAPRPPPPTWVRPSPWNWPPRPWAR